MRDYASARIADAGQVLATHRGDPTGRCVSCGRWAPCPEFTAAEQLYLHYREWLDVAPPPSAGDEPAARTRPELVRPYVRRPDPK